MSERFPGWWGKKVWGAESAAWRHARAGWIWKTESSLPWFDHGLYIGYYPETLKRYTGRDCHNGSLSWGLAVLKTGQGKVSEPESRAVFLWLVQKGQQDVLRYNFISYFINTSVSSKNPYRSIGSDWYSDDIATYYLRFCCKPEPHNWIGDWHFGDSKINVSLIQK